MKKFARTIMSFLILIMIWQCATYFVQPLFIPKPATVLNDFFITLKNGQLIKAFWYSFIRIMIAVVLSAVISVPLGLLVYNSSVAKDMILPIVNLMRYLPVTAFYPLLIMWFGIDELMKVVFLFIASFVYMMPSVILCLEEIPQDLIDTGKTIGMNRRQIITKVQLPSSLPSIMNSFVVMIGIGWTYIAVAETINPKYGLGYIIQQSSARGRTDLVFMAIIVIMIVSIIIDNYSKWLIRKIFKWRYINDGISDE